MQVQHYNYNRPAVVLHWLIAALIIANVALAWTWDHLATADARLALNTHKSIGITVLGLALLRLLWRISHRPPPLPPTYRSWERKLSTAVHGLLYLVMFALPLSGWITDSARKTAASHPIIWFGLFEWPHIGMVMQLPPATREHMHELFGATHSLAALALYALLFLHIGGALKHQFLDREKELQRMAFGPRQELDQAGSR